MKRGRHRRAMSDINVVPYIDVMLVLLIIFMVTAPLLTEGVKIDLPKASANPVDRTQSEPLVVTVDAVGNYYVNASEDERIPIDEATLLARTAAVLELRPQTQVLVKGDTNVEYGRVVRAMVVLQAAGASSIGLLTEPGSGAR